jgi:serine/threonine-protein kinase
MGYVELCFRREGRFLRWCARKRLHESLRSDATFRSMFMDEARLAGLVRHPNAVGVLDVGEDDDGPFLIMDFVEGISLSRVVAEAAQAGRRIPIQVAVRICLDAAKGLHAAHEVRSEEGTVLRLVHRDVSPQNILIGFDGTVRVTDFGIAKALGNTSRTSAGVLKGNIGYLSPEQLRFEDPDRRSDFFSLGVTFYELLSGERLYPNTEGFDGTRRILSEPPPDIGEVRSDVPPELVELLFELLAKDREGRPSTAAEIASRLEGVLAVLIAEEGSLTVADYMDQHFAGQRQERRDFLAEQVRRLDAEPRRTPQSVQIAPTGADATAPASLTRRRSPGKWLLAGAIAALGTVVVVFGLRQPPVGMEAAARIAADRQVARAANPPPAPVPEQLGRPIDAVPVAAAPETRTPPADVSRVRVARKRSKADRRVPAHRSRASAEKGSNDPNRLAVPLFTRWQ